MALETYKPNIDDLMAKKDVKGLIAALNHDDLVIRKEASSALKYVGDESAVDALIESLTYDDWQSEFSIMGSVRANSAEALGKIGDIRALYPLIDALKDSDSEVRWKSAEALGKIKVIDALEPLINSLNDEDEYVRKYAAKSLGELKDPRAVDPLIDSLKDKDWMVRKTSANSLGRIGEIKALKPLLDALRDEDSDVRRQAINALENMKNHAVGPLLEILYDRNWQTRAVAADALGRIGDPRAVEFLAEIVSHKRNKDENRYVRGKAAEALGRIGDPQAIPFLEAALEEEYIYVRKKAKEALELIKMTKELENYESESFTFKYPSAWEISEIKEETKLITGKELESTLKFSINIKKDVEDLSADDFADLIVEVFNKQNVIKASKNPVMIDGFPGFVVESENFEVEPPQKNMVYVFRSDEDLYYISFSGSFSDMKDSSKYIRTIVNSFHLKFRYND